MAFTRIGGTATKAVVAKAGLNKSNAVRGGSIGTQVRAVPKPPGGGTGRPHSPPTTGVGSTAHPALPGAVAPAPPAQPAVPWQNPAYELAKLQAAQQHSQNLVDPTSQLAMLTARDANGRTIYDRHMLDTTNAYNNDRYSGNANLASRGVLNSGGYDEQMNALNRQLQQTSDGLYQNEGGAAQSRLHTAVDTENQNYAQMLAQLATSSQQQNLNDNAQSGAAAPLAALSSAAAAPGSTQPQSPGVQQYAPHGWKAGHSGFFQANGQWHFINAAGEIAHGVAAPKANNTVFR